MNADEQTAVLTFGLRMHAKLNQNMHKGGRENWLNDSPTALMNRLRDELVELQTAQAIAVMNRSRGKASLKEDAEAIANECADVANFAMMISDSGKSETNTKTK